MPDNGQLAPQDVAAQAQRRAVELCALVGVRATGARAIVGLGTLHHVVVVDSADGVLVVRWRQEGDGSTQQRVERWCLSVAPAHGIAVPTLVAEGVADGVAFQVLEYIEGASPAAVPRTWQQLGEMASVIATIGLGDAPDAVFTRFGRDPASAWQRHLAYHLDSLGDDDPLVALGVLSPADVEHVRAVVSGLRHQPLDQGLDHGDLVPGNVIERSGRPGEFVVLDWETASVGPAPWAALDRVHRWSGPPAEVEAAERWFRRGAGLTRPGSGEVLRALHLVKALDLVRWARDRAPDQVSRYARVAQGEVQRCREHGWPDAGAAQLG